MPRGIRNVDVAIDQNLGNVDPQTGERPDLIQEIEPVHNMVDFNDKARKIQFYEEPVEIYLHESSNPNEEPAIFLACNGEPATKEGPWLLRGRAYSIKRKFVEILVRARTTSFSQPNKNSNIPEAVNQLTARRAQRYPFSVQRDTPEGAKWLQSLMAA